jgi:hypothetical protein
MPYQNPQGGDPQAFQIGTSPTRRGTGTDCVTSILEQFVRAINGSSSSNVRSSAGDINGISITDRRFNEFRNRWQISGGINAPEARRGAVGAIERAGIGREVYDIQDIRAGDLIQAWNDTTSSRGHLMNVESVQRSVNGALMAITVINANVERSRNQSLPGGVMRETFSADELARRYQGEIHVGRFFDTQPQ